MTNSILIQPPFDSKKIKNKDAYNRKIENATKKYVAEQKKDLKVRYGYVENK